MHEATFADPETDAIPAANSAFELWFANLVNPGTGVSFGCSASGEVDMDAMPEKLREHYLRARALIGRIYAYPVIRPVIADRSGRLD